MNLTTAADLMTRKVISFNDSEAVTLANELMQQCRLNRVPVVHDGKLVGIVTRNDLLASQLNTHDTELPLGEVMSSPVDAVDAAAPAEAVIARMIETHHHCLPVVKNDALVGIVTDSDMLRYAQTALAGQTRARMQETTTVRSRAKPSRSPSSVPSRNSWLIAFLIVVAAFLSYRVVTPDEETTAIKEAARSLQQPRDSQKRSARGDERLDVNATPQANRAKAPDFVPPPLPPEFRSRPSGEGQQFEPILVPELPPASRVSRRPSRAVTRSRPTERQINRTIVEPAPGTPPNAPPLNPQQAESDTMPKDPPDWTEDTRGEHDQRRRLWVPEVNNPTTPVWGTKR